MMIETVKLLKQNKDRVNMRARRTGLDFMHEMISYKLYHICNAL